MEQSTYGMYVCMYVYMQRYIPDTQNLFESNKVKKIKKRKKTTEHKAGQKTIGSKVYIIHALPNL